MQVQLDSLRKENMFISRFTRQTPLLFDPSGEGYACMRALHPAHNWQTIGMDESGCVSRALDAVAAGGSVLLRLDEYTINLNMLTHLASAYQARPSLSLWTMTLLLREACMLMSDFGKSSAWERTSMPWAGEDARADRSPTRAHA